MAEWKKVIVSGSSAELSSLSLDTALPVAEGGTGATSFTAGGVLFGNGTNSFTVSAVLDEGQLLIGNNSGLPNLATLTEGNGVTITNGAGSITLAIDGTDAVTFSNNASIFSGSFSGSFEGDGSNLTGVSATSFDFDGLPAITSLGGGDFFAASQGGTESKITFANISSSIYGGVSGDAAIAAGGTLTISDNAVTNAKLTDMTQGTVKVGGAANAPSDLDASGDGNILVGDGTDINSVAVSGDVALANNGTVTISDNAVTNAKLTDMTQGTVKVGGASNAPTDLDASGDGQILVGDGTDINSVAVSGDATLASDGTLTLKSGIVSSSVLSSATQGTAVLTTNGVAGSTIDLGLETGDSPTFANLTITNDLTVQGTTTSLETTNLTIEDQFITIASGSQSATDGGFIVSKQADGAGFAVGYDTTTTRWVLDADLAVNATDIVADAYLSTIEVSAAAPSAAPVYGGASNGYGNMHVKTDTGDIYIYA